MGAKPEKEQFETQKEDLFLFEKFVQREQIPIRELDELIPGIVHINRIDDVSIQFLNQKGCEMYEHSFEDISRMGNEIFQKYTHPDTIEFVFPEFGRFLESSDEHAVGSVFQQVRFYNKEEYDWVYTAFKKLRGSECWIGLSHSLSEMGAMGKKFRQLLEDNHFIRKQFKRFATLTTREKEVLSLVAKGFTNKMISEHLFISEHTVRTHRNRIWKKLDIKHLKDAIRIAEAFELI